MTDDDVRRKRLARLGGAGGPPTPVSNAVTAPDAAVDTAGVGSSAGGTAASSSSLVAEAQRSAPPKPLKAAVAPKPAPAPSSLSSQPSTKMDIDKVPSGRKKKTRIERLTWRALAESVTARSPGSFPSMAKRRVAAHLSGYGRC